tara:strand:+ start:65 stop:721 length:657 start_codon:yes stop_codon:yes gene_type:complete
LEINLNDVSTGYWCKYCGHKTLCKNAECQFCLNNSFASHEKAKYWHPSKNYSTKPRDVFKSSNKKCWFICSDCNHDFEISLSDVSAGRWCPVCVYKTEAKFKLFLEKNTDSLQIVEIIHRFRPEWANLRKTHGTFYEYDFYVILKNGAKIIFEIDGPQHYVQISNWGSPLLNQTRDNIKERLAKKNLTCILRLYQPDVWMDKCDWQDQVKCFINQKTN